MTMDINLREAAIKALQDKAAEQKRATEEHAARLFEEQREKIWQASAWGQVSILIKNAMRAVNSELHQKRSPLSFSQMNDTIAIPGHTRTSSTLAFTLHNAAKERAAVLIFNPDHNERVIAYADKTAKNMPSPAMFEQVTQEWVENAAYAVIVAVSGIH